MVESEVSGLSDFPGDLGHCMCQLVQLLVGLEPHLPCDDMPQRSLADHSSHPKGPFLPDGVAFCVSWSMPLLYLSG